MGHLGGALWQPPLYPANPNHHTAPTGSRAVPDHAEPPLFTLHVIHDPWDHQPYPWICSPAHMGGLHSGVLWRARAPNEKNPPGAPPHRYLIDTAHLCFIINKQHMPKLFVFRAVPEPPLCSLLLSTPSTHPLSCTTSCLTHSG